MFTVLPSRHVRICLYGIHSQYIWNISLYSTRYDLIYWKRSWLEKKMERLRETGIRREVLTKQEDWINAYFLKLNFGAKHFFVLI